MWQPIFYLLIIFAIRQVLAFSPEFEFYDEIISVPELNLNLFFDDCDGANMIFESQTPAIGSNFIYESKMTCLNLENRGISGLSSQAFDALPNLEHLNLGNNKLTKEKLLSHGKHENLKILVLDKAIRGGYRNLTGFSGYLKVVELKGYFPKMERLYLRNNSIAVISTIHGKSVFPNLTHLYLNNNELTNESPYFDRSFSWLPKSLKEIHFENNDIDYLGLGEFHNLEWISVDNNRITFITIWNLPKLKYLSGINNNISWVSDFSDSPELKILNLANNRIRHLNHIHRMPSLELLILDNNFFHSIPKIEVIPKITTLSMRCNEIRSLVSWDFLSMSSLKRLYLDNNRIKFVNKKSFENLINLEILTIEQNKLTHLLPGWMVHLKRLRELNLKGNSLLNIKALGLSNDFGPNLRIWLESTFKKEINYRGILPVNITLNFETESAVRICKKGHSKAIHGFDWTEHKW